MIILAIYFQQKNKWKQKYEAIPAKNKKKLQCTEIDDG